MALKSRNTSIAVIKQSVRGTFVDPAANLMPVSNLQETISSVTVANTEYNGAIDQNGDEIAGKNTSYTFDVYLRPPGGADVPAANAWLPGLFLQNAKMTEVRTATAIPASPEALSSGSETGFTGGAGLTATAGLYKGKLVRLLGVSTGLAGMSVIRSYSAAKAVVLCDEYGSALSGNYQIPKQLSYEANVTATDPLPLSLKVWVDGLRYDLVDCQVTALQISVPTTTRESAAIPTMSVTVTGILFNSADETTPAIPALGTTPKFRNGKQFLAYTAVGGSGFDLDMGLTAAAAPNPNFESGAEGDEMVSKQVTITPDILGYRKADFDALALADAQAYHPFCALWGSGSGGIIAIAAADVRLSHAGRTLGDNFVTQAPQLLVDVFDKNVTICFPYF